jgi:hypothetical protein
MALPDKNAAEDVVEIDETTWAKYLEAAANVEGWTKIRDGLKDKIQALLGSATAVVVDGQKVATYRPSDKWAETRIVKDYPDLAQHFMYKETKDVFNMEAFALRHPDIAAAYRVRQFRKAGQ